jgi:hypothetical protein
VAVQRQIRKLAVIAGQEVMLDAIFSHDGTTVN